MDPRTVLKIEDFREPVDTSARMDAFGRLPDHDDLAVGIFVNVRHAFTLHEGVRHTGHAAVYPTPPNARSQSSRNC